MHITMRIKPKSMMLYIFFSFLFFGTDRNISTIKNLQCNPIFYYVTKKVLVLIEEAKQ